MAHFALLWKARTIEKCRKNYENEKLISIRISNAQIEKRSLFQRMIKHDLNVKKRLSERFRKLYPEGSTIYNIFVYMKTDQTFPNFVLKSVIGFVGGIVLTYLCFMFFVFQLSISLMHATIMSSIIGVLLTLGLAFSYRIRCLVFLLLPQFFSRVGRYTLTCYALVLILTGPATNTLKNSEVLSESMACAQEQIKTNVHQMNELSENPMNAMKDSIRIMIDSVRQVAGKLEKALLTINRLVLSIINVIQSSFAWLASVSKVCNKKLGTPYERCIKVLNDAVLDCQASFGPRFSELCNVNYVADVACAAVKNLKSFCTAAELMNDSVVGNVKRKLKAFTDRVNSMLHVQLHVYHSYSFSSNTSRTASQVAAGIVTEIRKRADPLLTWLSWSSCVTSLFLLLIIFRAKYYQHMFETRSRFDNRYVTKELRDLDLKRLRQGRETVLPLNRREKAKYIKTTSFRLVASEKVHLSRSAVSMVITSFKLTIHMVADYSLYWVLMTIRHHGRFQSPLQTEPPNAGAYISDTGPLARIIRSILWSMSLPLAPPIPSTVYCLPDPYPPDLQRYTQIGILIVLLWFFALFEPYGLRLRHVIMGLYRPERAKSRAVWLYNHIQRTRGGFMKFARRKLHRDYKYSTEAKYTFKRWLDSHIPFSCIRSLLGTSPGEPKCLLCGTIEYQNDPDNQIVRCEIENCPGTYCTRCFSDIGNLCTICLNPIEYGDLSDISLEKGSSEESSDSEDNTDKDSKSASDPNAEKSAESTPSEAGKSDNSIHKRELTGLKVYNTRKKNNETQEGISVLNARVFETNGCDINNGRIRKQALKIRHRKYCTRDHDNNISPSFLTKFSKQNVAPFYCKHCQPHNKICDRKAVSSTVKYVKSEKNIKNINDLGKTLSFNQKSEDYGKYFKDNKLIRNRIHSKHVIKVRAYSINKIIKKLKKTNQSKKEILRTSSLLHYISILKKRKEKNSTCLKRKRSDFKLNWSKPNIKLVVLSALHDINQLVQFGKIVKITKKIRTKRHLRRNIKSKMSINNLKSVKFQNKITYFVKTYGNKESAKNTKKSSKNIKMVICSDNNSKAKPITIKVNAENTDNSGSSEQDGGTPGFSYSSKTFRYYIGKVHNLFANYLPKPNSGFSTKVKFLMNYFRNDNIGLTHEKINHKRRKKSSYENSSINNLKKHKANKKDNEDIRKYRLSTYLSEQDWIKRFNKKVSSTNPNRNILEMIDEANETAIPKVKTILEEQEVEILKNKFRWKRESNMELKKFVCLNQKRDLTSNNGKIIEKTQPSQISTPKNLIHVSSSSTYAGKMVNVLNMAGKDEDQYIPDQENNMEESYTSTTSIDCRMSQTLNFYRSLGNNDFDSKPEKYAVDQFIDDLYKENKDSVDFDKMKPSASHKDLKSQKLNKEIQPIEDAPHFSKLKPKQSKAQRFCDLNIDKIKMDSSQENKVPENHSVLDDTGNLSDSGCPLSIIKYFLCRRRPKKCSKDKEEVKLKQQGNADDNVFPVIQSCACQHLSKIQPFQDRATQCLSMKNVSLSISQHVQDAEVDAVAKTCTCGAQYARLSKDVGTYHRSKYKRATCKEASTIHYNALRVKSCRDAATVHYNCFKGMRNSATQCWRNINDSYTLSSRSKSATVTYDLNTKDKLQPLNKRSTRVTQPRKGIVRISSVETLHSRCSLKSDEGTKTDTTICSCTIDYLNDTPKSKKTKRLKVNVITKTNQSTTTDKKSYCDIGTATNDWWSPIVERKQNQISLLEKKGSYLMTERLKNMEMKMRKQKRTLTEGKVVKFQSRAQIIPAGNIGDILSPSRYLLESQKYYNELFTPKFHAPYFITAMSSVQTQEKQDKKRTPIHTKKSSRPKRLESYSPRKFEYKWTAETGNQMRSSSFLNQHRTGTKLNTKKPRNVHKQAYEKGTSNITKSKKRILRRGYTSTDDLSGACNCPSTAASTTTGSY